jgi:hypothetical protein
MSLFLRSAVVSGLAILQTATTASAVGLENHRIMARGALDLLPEAIAPLFASNRPAFTDRAVEPATVWMNDPDKRRRQTWHRVPLDLGVSEQTRDARLKAAGRFPRSEAGVKSLYQAHHVRAGGTLPWAVAELYRDLVEAMKTGREDDIVRAAGYLTHFAGECASPFNTTTDFDGQFTDNLRFGEQKPGEAGYAHQDVRYRFDMELVNRNAGRYAEKARATAAAGPAVADPVDGAFLVLLDSLACLDEILSADRQIIQRLGVTDGAGLLARADEYYVLFDERCGEVCIERLRAGAILAAGLIRGAWEAAGKPSVDDIRARQAAGAQAPQTGGTPSSAPQPASAGGFVGSRGSQVFHRVDCPHAARIDPANAVRFKTVREATAQGRRACKACNPSD